MGMKELWKEAKALQKELVEIRRYLHENAETGFALDKTVERIGGELEKAGYAPQKCGKAGLVATVGRGKRVFLLRADMDALPIEEESGEPFACRNGNMHACGHDLHATMLVGAAKLLKTREKELGGVVKLLFQPAEEILQGAKNVIEAGVLETPKVEAAMMLHAATRSPFKTGTAVVASAGVGAPAADYFTIEIRGKGCHGSAPWQGVDALTVAARILLALQEISARELSESAVLTVGSLKTGDAGNAISDRATLEGTLRAFDEETRGFVKKRMAEISENVARAFRARAKIVYGGGCPTLMNDERLSSFAKNAAEELLGKDMVFSSDALNGAAREKSGGSEDFAYISHEIPSVMVSLAAGEKEKGYEYPLHHPKARFDEEALSFGCALYAHVAIEWLKTATSTARFP